MSRLRPLWLLLILLAAGVAGMIATIALTAAGLSSPVLPGSSIVTLAAVALIILCLGLVVWRDQRRLMESRRRKEHQHQQTPRPARRLHPLQAVRVAAAAQACAYAGALIAGWHIGIVLNLAPAAGWGTPNITASVTMSVGGLTWVAVGFVVESMCRLPPDSGQDAGGAADDTETGPLDGRPHTGYARESGRGSTYRLPG